MLHNPSVKILAATVLVDSKLVGSTCAKPHHYIAVYLRSVACTRHLHLHDFISAITFVAVTEDL